MTVFIAADHAGTERKNKIIEFLQAQKISVRNFESTNLASPDYPDYADVVCRELKSRPDDFGILICGSGQGMAMRANKYSYIRAALCWSEESAKLSREHNNANILCLAARLLDEELSFKLVNTFLKTSFAGGRHEARVVKVGAPV